jgi:hypothetical protein
MVLGCNDDAEVPPRSTASTITLDGAGGMPIWIIVAGSTGGLTSTGTFNLTVTEQKAVALGGACDPNEITSYCPQGQNCVPDIVSGAAVCLVPGSAHALCRILGSACDAPLICSGQAASSESRCLPSIALGGSCDLTETMNTCSAPNQCTPMGAGATCQPQAYTESTIPNPTFIDACATGTRVVFDQTMSTIGAPPRDDGHPTAPIVLPFPFAVFGQSEAMIWPDSNGYATFGDKAPLDLYTSMLGLPERFESPAIFPFWEDLVLRSSPASDVCYLTTGTAPNRTFTLEYFNTAVWSASDPDNTHVTFEAQLQETTNAIDFIYQTQTAGVNDGSYVDGSLSTIGVQSRWGVEFHGHVGRVSGGIRFTP